MEEKYEWKKTNNTETDLGWLGHKWADHSFVLSGYETKQAFPLHHNLASPATMVVRRL